MSKDFQKGEQVNPFANGEPELSLEEADSVLYGVIPESGRVVARPIPLEQIRPDRAQPRRAIPLIVRGEWDGSSEAIPELLDLWYEGACNQYGKSFDVAAILLGRKSLDLDEDSGSILLGFNKLMDLAGSIHREGLTNPITVEQRGREYVIETGERRYLAHHLLRQYVDSEKYSRIPAREVEYDVFRQASENNARSELNAIELARQIALLIMSVREGIDGQTYDSIDDLVLPGECDRRFYAQVANGNIHRIPQGMGDRISSAIGLSKARISQYRRLLELTDNDELNDRLWIEADTNDWPEKVIRERAQDLLEPERLTRVNLNEQGEGENEHDASLTGVDDQQPGEGETYPKNDETLTRVKVNEQRKTHFGMETGASERIRAGLRERGRGTEPKSGKPDVTYQTQVERRAGFEPGSDEYAVAQGNALSSEQLVTLLDVGPLIYQLRHIAAVLDSEHLEMLETLLKFTTEDLETMANETTPVERIQYIGNHHATIHALLEDVAMIIDDFIAEWTALAGGHDV